MSTRERWINENEKEHGNYAAFVGFEADISDHDRLGVIYDDMDIYDKIALFGFIWDLLEEEEKGKCQNQKNWQNK